jgi:integrase
VKAAGLEGRHPVPHSLRHTHASHLIAGGVDAVTVASRLGHSRTSVTTDIYGHLLAGGDRAAVDELEALRKASAKKAKKRAADAAVSDISGGSGTP